MKKNQKKLFFPHRYASAILTFFTALLSAAILALTLGVSASSPSPKKGFGLAGYILYTDITTLVNGNVVEGYNIGGETFIILEDLARFGAQAVYNNDLRTLTVNCYSLESADSSTDVVDVNKKATSTLSYPQGAFIGKAFGGYYYSDITVYLNGIEIKAYSINGKMAASIEKIGAAQENSPYSEYNAKFSWDGQNRIARLDFLTKHGFSNNDVEKLNSLGKILDDKKAAVNILNNRLYFEKSLVPAGSSISAYFDGTEQFEIPKDLIAEYYGKEYVVGKVFSSKSCCFLIHDDGTAEINFDSSKYNFTLDFPALIALANSMDKNVFSREEAIEYFTGPNFNLPSVALREDFDEYTFMLISSATPHGSTHSLLRICDDGSYTNYSQYFAPQTVWGIKIFDDVCVRLDSKTVDFIYNGNAYTIDLETGELSEKS